MKNYTWLLSCVFLLALPASAFPNDGSRSAPGPDLGTAPVAQPRATLAQHHHHGRRFLGCVRNDRECEHIAHDDHGYDHHSATHSHDCEDQYERRHFACYGWND